MRERNLHKSRGVEGAGAKTGNWNQKVELGSARTEVKMTLEDDLGGGKE